MKIIITTPIMYLFMLPVDNKVKGKVERWFEEIHELCPDDITFIFLSLSSSHVICIFTLKV